MMMCKACGSPTDQNRVACSRCGDEFAAPAGGSADAEPADADSYGTHIAAAEARLAALSKHLAAVEAERIALSKSLASARRALAQPAQSDGLSQIGVPRRIAIDAGPLRLTFPDPRGARVEPIVCRPVAAAAPPVSGTMIDIPSIDLRTAAATEIWEALTGGARTVRVAGEPGAGATTLLAILARDARDHGFADGALYLTDVRGPATDIGQRLAALVGGPDAQRYYLPAELRALFAKSRALICLDRAEITSQEQAELSVLFPDLRFVVVDSFAIPGTPSVALGPLAADDALLLAADGYGRRIEAQERNAALALVVSVGALPGRSRVIGIAARELSRSFVSLQAEFATGNEIVAALIGNLSATERYILSIIAMAPAVLDAERLAGVVGSEIGPPLERLLDCELVCKCDGDRYEMPGYVEPLVPLPHDPLATFERITELLRAQLDRRPTALTERELIAAEGIMQSAQRFDWLSVLTLGPALAQALALRGLFGAWGRVLGIVTAAAKRADDPVALNSARHDLGVRHLLLGEQQQAITALRTAALHRERMGDHAGASASSAALAFVRDVVPSPASLPPRGPAPLPPRGLTERPGSRAVELAEASGAGRPEGNRSSQRTVPRSTRSTKPQPTEGKRTALLATRTVGVPLPLWFIALAVAGVALLGIFFLIRPKPAPAIAEFSTNRASIENGSRAQLCIRATGAARLAIAPDVGPLVAKGKHCVVVRPDATTTYTAVATGSGGQTAHRAITVAVSSTPRPLKINAFAATPPRIEAGESTRLCYDVNGADLLRIVPQLGDLERLHSCESVTLTQPHDYTYDLVAWGDNGQVAVRRARIEVVARATPETSTTPETSRSSETRPSQVTSRSPETGPSQETSRSPEAGRSPAARVLAEAGRLQEASLLPEASRSNEASRSEQASLLPEASRSKQSSRSQEANLLPEASRSPETGGSKASPTAVPAPTATPDDHLARRAVYQFDATPAVVERGQVASLCVGVGRWAQGDVTAIGTLEPGITRCYRVKPSATTVYRLHVALDKSVAYETVTVAVRPPAHRH